MPIGNEIEAACCAVGATTAIPVAVEATFVGWEGFLRWKTVLAKVSARWKCAFTIAQNGGARCAIWLQPCFLFRMAFEANQVVFVAARLARSLREKSELFLS